ncbi:MAG TPA: hypothetical protein VN905_08335 [Candidatus Binatia bacterium]|nr:hypothetical protein [Candidatus Binatia bacterium]
MLLFRRYFHRKTVPWLIGYALLFLACFWAFNLPLSSKDDWVRAIVLSVLAASMLTGVGTLIRTVVVDQPKLERALDGTRKASRTAELRRAGEAVNEPTQQIYSTWDVALGTLENFWNTNKVQNGQVFVLSVGATVLGFLVLIVSIVLKAFNIGQSQDDIAIIAGVLSQFIGATLLIVYRSTVSQSSRFAEALERILTAGMSAAIVETIEGSEPEVIAVRNKYRGEVAIEILRGSKEKWRSVPLKPQE